MFKLLYIIRNNCILTKKYLAVVLLFSVLAPIFLQSKLETYGGDFLIFFIPCFMSIYLVHGNLSTIDFKNKGSSLLATTPYTRRMLVVGEYSFLFLLFFAYVAIFCSVSQIVPRFLTSPSILTIGLSFCIISFVFSIYIPILYKLGYEKTKFVSFILVFAAPFLSPVIAKFVSEHGITLDFMNKIQYVPFLLASFIGILSMIITIYIYKYKDL